MMSRTDTLILYSIPPLPHANITSMLNHNMQPTLPFFYVSYTHSMCVLLLWSIKRNVSEHIEHTQWNMIDRCNISMRQARDDFNILSLFLLLSITLPKKKSHSLALRFDYESLCPRSYWAFCPRGPQKKSHRRTMAMSVADRELTLIKQWEIHLQRKARYHAPRARALLFIYMRKYVYKHGCRKVESLKVHIVLLQCSQMNCATCAHVSYEQPGV